MAALLKGVGEDEARNRLGKAETDAQNSLPATASQSEIAAAKTAARTAASEQMGKDYNSEDVLQGFRDEGNKNAYDPGSADVGGGPGMGEQYRQAALAGMHGGDASYDANAAALNNSVANMKQDRGDQAVENQKLLAREAAGRSTQMDALGLSREAALGGGPSASAYQTRGAMDSVMGGQASAMGSAHGLSALGGAQSGTGLATQAGNAAVQGGMGRSREMSDNIGMYGSQASAVRGGDLSRLHEGDSNSIFNSNLNNSWKVGNANLAAKQGELGNQQENLRGAWYDASAEPAKKQAQYDQIMQGMEHGMSAGDAAARIAQGQAEDERNRSIAKGVASGVGGALGSFGGPVGTAGGAAFGGMLGSSLTSKDGW